LYSHGDDVEPVVAIESDRVLSSGTRALIVIDGRHRTFAAANAGADRLPAILLTSADAVFSSWPPGSALALERNARRCAAQADAARVGVLNLGVAVTRLRR
jgi:hypothetical protein